MKVRLTSLSLLLTISVGWAAWALLDAIFGDDPAADELVAPRSSCTLACPHPGIAVLSAKTVLTLFVPWSVTRVASMLESIGDITATALVSHKKVD